MEAKGETTNQYPISCLSYGQEEQPYFPIHWYMHCVNLLRLPLLTAWTFSEWITK